MNNVFPYFGFYVCNIFVLFTLLIMYNYLYYRGNTNYSKFMTAVIVYLVEPVLNIL